MTLTNSNNSLSTYPTAQMGGKKKNGHKASCGCPICVNMKHSKRGGGFTEEDTTSSSSSMSTSSPMSMSMSTSSPMSMSQSAGRKKRRGNGHKPNCGCPICKNMRKSKNGGADEEDQQGDIEEGFAPSQSEEVDSAIGDANEDDEIEATSEDYDINSAELGEAGPGTKAGGSRRRKRRTAKKSKKTRKSRKTRRQKKRTTRRR
jgi:hypothetical protein